MKKVFILLIVIQLNISGAVEPDIGYEGINLNASIKNIKKLFLSKGITLKKEISIGNTINIEAELKDKIYFNLSFVRTSEFKCFLIYVHFLSPLPDVGDTNYFIETKKKFYARFGRPLHELTTESLYCFIIWRPVIKSVHYEVIFVQHGTVKNLYDFEFVNFDLLAKAVY